MRYSFLPSWRRVLAASCLLALLGVSVASAAQQQATDPETNYNFALDGTALTVTAAQPPAEGQRVSVTCIEGITSFYVFLDSLEGGKESESYSFALASAQADWPAAQAALTVTLPRDVSAGADGCLLERAFGSDIAKVGFTSAGREALGQGDGRDQSHDANAVASLRNAASAAAADRSARGRFATGVKLARVIRRYEPSLTVRALKVPLKQAQLQPGIVYVLKDSTARRLRLAFHSRSGKLWVLTYNNTVTIKEYQPKS